MRKMRMLAGTAALAAALAAPAVATADGAMTIGGSAALVGKGAGVLVPVEVTCGPSGSFPMGSSVVVTLRQRVGNRIAEGTGSAQVVCDGTPHTAEALVAAKGVPFKPGVALATATGFVCDMYGCQSMSDTAELRIRS